MLVVALTGSIGMGKTTVAARLRRLGIAVFDADAEVHALYEGAAVAPIEAVLTNVGFLPPPPPPTKALLPMRGSVTSFTKASESSPCVKRLNWKGKSW